MGAVKREAAVTKEMNKKLADDKKISKKEKDERILWKKNEVAEYESTTFSIFYNNALFLALVIIASFYILSVSDFITHPQCILLKLCVIYLSSLSFVRAPPPTSTTSSASASPAA